VRLTTALVAVGVAAHSACRVYYPEEPTPIVVTNLTVTIDGEEVIHEDHAVVSGGPDEVAGPSCASTWRIREGLGESMTVSIDGTAWADGAPLLPGPEDARTGGYLTGPATGLVAGGVGTLHLDGAHAALRWTDGTVFWGDDPTPFSVVELAFDGEVPTGEWRHPGGVPGEVVAPSGLPWCTLPAWEVEGWERIGIDARAGDRCR
jgi:hypothetical protein